jgi:hypothetical protein
MVRRWELKNRHASWYGEVTGRRKSAGASGTMRSVRPKTALGPL